MKRLISILLIISMAACADKKQAPKKDSTTDTEPVKLVFLEKTNNVFHTPESVCYDRQRNVFYVSNVADKPLEKDTNGFISIIDLTAQDIVKELKWIKGLNAPKGMVISGKFLYVSDIDRVVKIDIEREIIVKSLSIEDSKFLNDMEKDANGNLYVSDMLNSCVYKIDKQDNVSVFADSLDAANGLVSAEKELFVGCSNGIWAVNTTSGQKRQVIEVADMAMIDGLKIFQKGFIVSDWKGKIYYIDTLERKQLLLLNTTSQKINAADLEYVEKQNLILVPTFSAGSVDLYKIVQ